MTDHDEVMSFIVKNKESIRRLFEKYSRELKEGKLPCSDDLSVVLDYSCFCVPITLVNGEEMKKDEQV